MIPGFKGAIRQRSVVAGGLSRELIAAFSAAASQNAVATNGRAARAKSVAPLAYQLTWLISAFHCSLHELMQRCSRSSGALHERKIGQARLIGLRCGQVNQNQIAGNDASFALKARARPSYRRARVPCLCPRVPLSRRRAQRCPGRWRYGRSRRVPLRLQIQLSARRQRYRRAL